MTTENPGTPLYWNGGPFRVRLLTPASVPKHDTDRAIHFLEAFREQCQKHYFAYHSAVNGIHQYREHLPHLFGQPTPDASLFIGTGVPGQEHAPGHSTIGRISQQEMLLRLQPSGAFESYQGKTFIVLVFHIWEEYYRPRIARALSVKPCHVLCDLMGDILRVRNRIIHAGSQIPPGFESRLSFLPQIWALAEGELTRETVGWVRYPSQAR